MQALGLKFFVIIKPSRQMGVRANKGFKLRSGVTGRISTRTRRSSRLLER